MRIIYNQGIDCKNYCDDNMQRYYDKKTQKLPKDIYTYDLNVVNEYNYKGKSVELNLDCECNEKNLDIQMEKVKYTRVFGIVKDLNGEVVKDTKVTLFRAELINYRTQYTQVCDMITDNEGRYEALIRDDNRESHYIVRALESEVNC